jgi:hypothetical protein
MYWPIYNLLTYHANTYTEMDVHTDINKLWTVLKTADVKRHMYEVTYIYQKPYVVSFGPLLILRV